MKSIRYNFILLILFIAMYLPPYVSVSFAHLDKDTTSKIDFNSAFYTPEGNTVLAKVGNKKITVREFLTSYEYGPAFAKRMKDSKYKYLNFMIDEKLLALEGYSEGYGDSSRVKDMVSAIEGDLITDQMFNKEIYDKITVSGSDLDTALAEKQFTYKLKWLYAPDKDSLEFYLSRLTEGVSFDSLFLAQLTDSIYVDQRSMQIDKFKLRIKNPQMYEVVDKLKNGEISKPVQGDDGWYLIKIVDIWKDVIKSASELEKEKSDAAKELKLMESDKQSDIYVRKLMLAHNPVIQGRAFDILRSYMGNFVLPKNKFESWKLDERMQSESNHYNSLSPENIGNIALVKLYEKDLTLNDFINWYRMRDEYLKFDEKDFNSFSASLEKLVWQMVRDHLLINRAYAKGYQNMPLVKQQLNWWKDKVVYAVVRDNLANNIGLNIELPSSVKSSGNKSQELIEITFRKIQQLKKKYKIHINEDILKNIEVYDSHDPRAVDFYIVKKGGTFPHPAFPSIDFSWQNWE